MKPLVLLFLLLLVPGCVFRHLLPRDGSGILMPAPLEEGESDSAFNRRVKADYLLIERSWQGLSAVVNFVNKESADFEASPGATLSFDNREKLLSVWRAFLDHFWQLEEIRLKYSGYWKINTITHGNAYALSLSAHYSALLAQQVAGSRFIALLDGRKAAETLLDEERPGLPAMSYSALRYRVLNLVTFQNIAALYPVFEAHAKPGLLAARDTLCLRTVEFVDAFSDTALVRAGEQDMDLTGKNALVITGQQTFEWLFPLQKNLADYMGHTRYRPFTRPRFITCSQIDSLKPLIQPGDLILNRSNWILSNVGLPGFWPHVAFYSGTLDEAKAVLEDDTGVQALVLEKSAGKTHSLVEYVRTAYPEAYAVWSSADSGNPKRVLEALANGLVFRPLEKTLNADYAAVLRPAVPARDKAMALLYVLGYHGTPYDFDFDFGTDALLVCSESVYKAYEKREGISRGISIPLQVILGRVTLPPNDYAVLFEREAGSPDPQFSFIAYLEGSESLQKAVFKDELEFRKTGSRPKWDFLQE